MADIATRDAYGKLMVELGKVDPNIVVLDSDLSHSTMTKYFAEAFPHRFFNCGLAEANMIGIAAGLAACGKTPFASSFAVFAASRCFDQLRVSVSQAKLNVKVVATHGGITVGEDGATHHAIEDIGLYCSLPGFRVIVPADAVETVEVIKVISQTPGPVYVRLMRPKTPVIFDHSYKFTLGKGMIVRPGKDATIIAIGIMVSKAIEAANQLAAKGIDCRVINMANVKPLDEDIIIQAAAQTGAILVAEEHLEQGGLGSRVATVVAGSRPVPMAFLAIKGTYVKSGKPDELLESVGLTTANIVKNVNELLTRKA